MLHDMLLTLSPAAASALKVGSAADMPGLPVRDLPLEPFLLILWSQGSEKYSKEKYSTSVHDSILFLSCHGFQNSNKTDYVTLKSK